MNNKKRVMVGIMVLAAVVAAFAEPVVTDVVAKQRYPWNGLVDITCKVTGINGTTNALDFSVAAVMPDSGDVRKASQFWVVRNEVKLADRAVHTNGNYRLLWDAQADLGQVRYDNMVVRVTTVKGHAKVQLWEGGPYWATTNIGAEEPEDYGYYFQWGATVGYKRKNNKWVATDGSSSDFAFVDRRPPTYGLSISDLQNQGWTTADSILMLEHDATHVLWGGAWRMPTKQEFADLCGKCDWSWTIKNEVQGYVVRGKGAYADTSIFLPCAGYGYKTSLEGASWRGDYWSSVPSNDRYYAWCLRFNSSGYAMDAGNTDYCRDRGHSIRPVQGFAK